MIATLVFQCYKKRSTRAKNHMSANADSNSADLQPKLMKGKYDKRCKSAKSIAAIEGAARSEKQLGRKPNWMKHLSRNKAWDGLREVDSIASLKEIYAYCWEKKLVPQMLQMREYLWNRAEGRPFVAENPETKAKLPGIQDERLEKAIAELIPKAKPATKSVM
jgi:hypothetical protein